MFIHLADADLVCKDKQMDIYGIDFTSRPTHRKPITCVHAQLEDDQLYFRDLLKWSDFKQFETWLCHPGPWFVGIDFPFGQSRQFIENIAWPKCWGDYVQHAHSLGRQGFREALDQYRQHRQAGDKEHRRVTDIATGAISPQKLYGVPVGLMFFEGAPRLLDAAVTIPHLCSGDPERIVVEAYPALLARYFIGRTKYKSDNRSEQTHQLKLVRQALLNKLTSASLLASYGIGLHAPLSLADDPSGDQLDALLCAIQAAWSWQRRYRGYGAPQHVDALEGWIADPFATGMD